MEEVATSAEYPPSETPEATAEEAPEAAADEAAEATSEPSPPPPKPPTRRRAKQQQQTPEPPYLEMPEVNNDFWTGLLATQRAMEKAARSERISRLAIA